MDARHIAQPLGAKPGMVSPVTAQVEHKVGEVHDLVRTALPHECDSPAPYGSSFVWHVPMVAPVEFQKGASFWVNKAKVMLHLPESLLLAQSEGKVGFIQMPAETLQAGLCAANVARRNDQVQVIGLAKANVSIEIEGEDRPLENHDGNFIPVKGLHNLSLHQRMPNRLDSAGIAALLQPFPRGFWNCQAGHTLEGGPTEGRGAVTIDEANVLRPVRAGSDGLAYGFFLILPP
jgi:hypothetical protein